ncbi:MAG: hypothetical protein AAGI08_00150 [Bacteroidota bacterium]
MSFWKTLVSPVTRIIEQVIDKVAGDKMDEAERAQLKFEAAKAAAEALQAEEESFRAFVLDYEGSASDMPRAIQVLRGSVRPVLTYALAVAFIVVQLASFFDAQAEWTPEQMGRLDRLAEMLYKVNLVSLGFWYGERLLTRTGLFQLFRNAQPSDS